MSNFWGFDSLKVGQRLKVKGEPQKNNEFIAFEVSIKPPSEYSELEGFIQAINYEDRTLQLLNSTVNLPSDIIVKSPDKVLVNTDNLKCKDYVKIKGLYSKTEGFAPQKIVMKESKGFQVEELQGMIESIDNDQKTFDMIGIKVIINEKTEIEGF